MTHHDTAAENQQSAIEHWNQVYGEKDQMWSGQPNAALVHALSGHASGTALDVGCGEGGDAVWLAEQGWTVTAIDVSTTALERAAAAADARGVGSQIDWQQIDLTEAMPAGEFDLVSAIFLQSRINFPREDILKSLTRNVAPGGLFLVVGHAEWPPWAQAAEHEHDRPVLHNAIETLTFLDLDSETWDVLICADQSREATSPDGESAELLDAVILIRRNPIEPVQ